MRTESRPCTACDGTGCSTREHAQHLVTPEGWGCWCPACLGTGHISDVMPQADSDADAETLREFERNPFSPSFLLQTFAPEMGCSEVGALRCGVDVELWARGHFYETERSLVDDATWSARAAFRAVSGLRGAR